MTNRSRTLGYVFGAMLFGAVVGFMGAEARHRPRTAASPATATTTTPATAAPVKPNRYADASRLPTGFQALPFGASEQTIRKTFLVWDCYTRESDATVRDCRINADIGAAPGHVTLILVNDKFVGVYATFTTAKWWPTIREGMVERFGQPTLSEVVPVRTAMNAEFDNERMVWSWSGAKVQAARFADTIDKGELSIELRSWTDHQRKIQSDGVKATAGAF